MGRPRHARDGRPALRWLAATGLGALLAAGLVLGFSSSAGAADSVSATFSVTGVSTSNCPVSTGGADVYVKPGQELDVKSSLVGLTVLGQPLDVSKIASLDGALVIDPHTSHAKSLRITGTVQKLSWPSSGNHAFTWEVSQVTLLGGLVPLPLHLSSSAASAGASLHYAGTIHVTTAAAKCGVAVQVPGVSASASVTGLPPISIGIPGLTVSLPVNVPSIPAGGSSGGHGGGSSSGGSGSSPAALPSAQLPVPAQVVPQGAGGGFGGGYGGTLGGLSQDMGAGNPGVLGSSSTGSAAKSGAASSPTQRSTGKDKTIDLAANKPSTGQLSVVLAIIAVIALTLVAATYARLYVLRKPDGKA